MAKAKSVQLPPKKEETAPEPKAAQKVSEKKIQDVIKKGGSVLDTKATEAAESFKNFNVKILESELATINQLREKRPKGRGKKLGISLHDWIIEAITEKMEREKKSLKQV